MPFAMNAKRPLVAVMVRISLGHVYLPLIVGASVFALADLKIFPV